MSSCDTGGMPEHKNRVFLDSSLHEPFKRQDLPATRRSDFGRKAELFFSEGRGGSFRRVGGKRSTGLGDLGPSPALQLNSLK